MKKLLALVLCVMLFVSVIPTFAFADLPEKIDLKPAVDQMNHLYAAYGDYFGKTALVTISDMFKSMGDQFAKDSNARTAALEASSNKLFKTAWKKMHSYDYRFSAEGLFNAWGKNITKMYNNVVSAARTDTINKYIEQCDKIDENIDAEIAKLDASVAAVVASTLAQMPAVP